MVSFIDVSEDTLWFFIFIIIIVLITQYTGILPAITVAIANLCTYKPVEKTGKGEESDYMLGGSDMLRDYLDGMSVSSDTTSKIDAKDLKLAKLRIASKKQITMESFVDKLVINTILYLKSLDNKPTDLALSMIGSNKSLLTTAADIIEKKYPDSRFTPSDLRELAKKIAVKTSAKYDDLVRIGDISHEELIAKYISLMAQGTEDVSLTDCKRELKSTTNTNETLRINNEKLREEIRRGLTSYNCDAILRDCRDEKDRLNREIRELKLRPNDSDNYRRDAQELRTRVSELQSIISAMQDAESRPNLDARLQGEIVQLKNQLSKCMHENDQLLTMIAQCESDRDQ